MLPLAMPRPLVESNVLPTTPVPTLLLDFLTGTYQRNDGQDQLITIDFATEATIQRNSTATYIGSDGLLKTASSHQPRFDHDPAFGNAPRGLLIEPAATNLQVHSQDFESSAYFKAGTSVLPNAATAPDGTSTADKLVESASSGNHLFVDKNYPSPGSKIAFSQYAKAAERQEIQLLVAGAGATDTIQANFNLIDGSVTELHQKGSAVLASAYTEFIGNGWYRCTLVGSLAAGETGYGAQTRLINAGNASYTGDSSSGVYIWGRQFEEGSIATSYILTGATAVTRATDLISMPWPHDVAGTYLASAEYRHPATGQMMASLDNGGGNHQLSWPVAAGPIPTLNMTTGGVLQADLSGSLGSGMITALASRVNINDIALAANGNPASADNVATLPTVDTVTFGSGPAGLPLNGWLRGFTFWPALFDDTKLTNLSSVS